MTPGECRFCRLFFRDLEPFAKLCRRCRELTKWFLCSECGLYFQTHMGIHKRLQGLGLHKPYLCHYCIHAEIPSDPTGRPDPNEPDGPGSDGGSGPGELTDL